MRSSPRCAKPGELGDVAAKASDLGRLRRRRALDRGSDSGFRSGAGEQDELSRRRYCRAGSIARARWSELTTRHRVALLPTQYLEQYDWGNPQFYIENSLIDRPLVYGLLGSEPSEGSDVWVRRAYRAMREGLPFAADMFRVLGVDTFLERDDFIPVIDFSSPGEARFNSITLTHDLLHRVLVRRRSAPTARCAPIV